MVKIERLKDDAKATYLRDGMRKPIFLHQLITREELATLEVTNGTVVYSIDELEIKEQSAKVSEPVAKTTSQITEEPVQQPARKLTAKEIVAQAKRAANNGRQ